MFQHIIWDFDGTLFDTYPGLSSALQKALLDFGVTVSADEILLHLMISGSHAIEYYRSTYALGEELKEKYTLHRKEAGMDAVKPFPGMKALCGSVASSGRWNYLYTNRGFSAVEAVRFYDMEPFFREFVVKENGFPRKPAPDALLWLTKKYGMKKNEALMIGDRDIDILAAKSAGIRSCYVDFKTRKSFDADYTAGTVEQLYAVIGLSR